MPNKKRNSKNSRKNSNITTTILSITSPIPNDEKTPIPTICINVNEQNNNSIALPETKSSALQCLPDIFTDIEISRRNSINNSQKDSYIKGDLYRPYIFDNENEKFSNLPPSSHGSLSSITTTSIASSEDPKGGDGEHGGKDFERRTSKVVAHRPVKQEEWWKTTLQVSIPFLIAGLGTIGAGIILGRVERWKVFTHVSELFILVPALLGLKGNLNMCLASRLSTQANLGRMSSRSDIIHMVVGNIALVQVQATVAAFIVAVFAISVGGAMNKVFIWSHAMLLIASNFVLVAVILLSHRFHMNPDNLATTLAASIGDVVSLSVLSFIASTLFEHLATHLWVTYVIVGIYSILLPVWATVVMYDSYTRPVLKKGWIPVLSALFISGMGGLVLDAAVDVFKGFVVFQPIINGIGGNLVSVQASKISTMLHQSSIIGIVPPHTTVCESPWRALVKGVPYARSARILILMSIPGQILFIYVTDYIHMSSSTIGVTFVLSYLSVSLLQICTLLYIAHIVIHIMWKYKIDPDNSAIPFLTALGDLFGSCLLAMAFAFMMSIGQPYMGGADGVAVAPIDVSTRSPERSKCK